MEKHLYHGSLPGCGLLPQRLQAFPMASCNDPEWDRGVKKLRGNGGEN
jgi:hypothetical protein